MEIVRVEHEGKRRYGARYGDEICFLEGEPYGEIRLTRQTVPASETRLLCPVVPGRVFGIGMNYHATAKAWSRQIPERPLLFLKPSTAVIGPGEPIIYPRQATQVVFEGELAIVIGKAGRRISEADALDHVLGLTCGNDLTERDLQLGELKAGSMMVSKGFDTFNPVGPSIITDCRPDDLDIEVRVNAELKQSGNTSDQIFRVERLISLLSEAITLLPGDIIMTGTPPGLGPVLPGDEIEVAIAGVGRLTNRVVKEDD